MEAHINALRSQLRNETPGIGAHTDDGDPCPGGERCASFSPPDGPQRPRHSVATAATAATDEAGCVDDTAINSGGEGTATGTAVPSFSIETRGNYHLSPTPAERSGNEGSLTEVEDMRLNRLLRASKSSTPSTPPPPSGEAANDGGSGRTTGSGDRLATVMAEYPLGDGIGDVARELFGTNPTPFSGDRGGKGWTRGKDAFAATRRKRSIVDEEEEDDLDDISDGGFHSGCWRRKYVRGEMR